jgi:hypothetical protein
MTSSWKGKIELQETLLILTNQEITCKEVKRGGGK